MESSTSILKLAYQEAISYLSNIDNQHSYVEYENTQEDKLHHQPSVASEVLDRFKQTYGSAISATSGKGYLGYVVGGAFPESIAADWLVSAYDMVSPAAPVTVEHEKSTLDMMKDLLQLPKSFDGSFVSGGTMSNYVNLSTARQWYYLQFGIDVAQSGICEKTERPKIFSATPHSSIYKCLAMMGLGRNNLQEVQKLSNSESIDVLDLEQQLQLLNGRPAIIVANAGTVNTGAFDDINSLMYLKKKYKLWIHIDATFGGMVSCTDSHRHLIEGWEDADSITIDAHKWLNVPYDSAFQFTRHMKIQQMVFQNGAGEYIKELGDYSYVNITPQGSRRWRSLPVWFALHTQGKSGYKDLIERNCRQAQTLGNYIKASPYFELADDVHLNIVCFKVSRRSSVTTKEILRDINTSTNFHLTSTTYKGDDYIRATFCNWRTTMDDVSTLTKVISKITKTRQTYNPQRLSPINK